MMPRHGIVRRTIIRHTGNVIVRRTTWSEEIEDGQERSARILWTIPPLEQMSEKTMGGHVHGGRFLLEFLRRK